MKKIKNNSVDGTVEKLVLCTVDRNVKRCSSYGKQYGSLPQNKKYNRHKNVSCLKQVTIYIFHRNLHSSEQSPFSPIVIDSQHFKQCHFQWAQGCQFFSKTTGVSEFQDGIIRIKVYTHIKHIRKPLLYNTFKAVGFVKSIASQLVRIINHQLGL